jgi:hypothetical protein
MRTIIGQGALATLAIVLASVPAAAQVCEGLTSFSGRPVQVYGAWSVKNGSRVEAGGVTVGGAAGGFLNFESGTTAIDALKGSAFTNGVGLGYQVALNATATAQLCPTADWTNLWGPDNVQGTGLDYSEHHRSVGATAGYIAAERGRWALIPTVGLALTYTSSQLADSAGHNVSSMNMTFPMLGLGVGVVFDHAVIIRPALAIPLNGMDSPIFQIKFGVNFGKGS